MWKQQEEKISCRTASIHPVHAHTRMFSTSEAKNANKNVAGLHATTRLLQNKCCCLTAGENTGADTGESPLRFRRHGGFKK